MTNPAAERLRPDVLDNSWQFVCEWYQPEEIRRCIANPRSGGPGPLPEIPGDTHSKEFADWLCEQYRLAMAKGIDLARSAVQARLSEHLPDDGEEIAKIWFRGQTQRLSPLDRALLTKLVDEKRITTRGQLRLLLRALGVEGEG